MTRTHIVSNLTNEDISVSIEDENNLNYKPPSDIELSTDINRVNKDDSLKIYEKKYKMFKINIKNTMKRHGQDITIKKEKNKRKKKCPHMMRRLAVLSNGSVYPCCVCYEEPEDIFLGRYPDLDLCLESKKGMIKKYKKGEYLESCKNCTSQEVYK